jgi:hypothetical protein
MTCEFGRPRWGSSGSSSTGVLTVNSCIKVRLDLQADKSPVVVKGPFFPRVVNPVLNPLTKCVTQKLI